MGYNKSTYLGYESIKLSFNHYLIEVITGRGCNLIRLEDTNKGISYLHQPDSDHIDEFLRSPQRYGSAILFHPNKIRGGKFNRNTRTYDLEENNIPSSHGLIKEFNFNIVTIDETSDYIRLVAEYSSKDGIYYKAFNWLFTVTFIYTINDEGVFQTVTFNNIGKESIPFGVGFHTSFQIPFKSKDSVDNYRYSVSHKYTWELDNKGFPTGNKLIKNKESHSYSEPLNHALSTLLDDSGNDNHTAIVTSISGDDKITYITDKNFNNWMIWNNNASDNYICIEPMTWIIDAPNSDLPDNESGYSTLMPGQVWSATNKFFF